MIVSANPRRTLAEFYPPPYNTLAPRVFRGMGRSPAQDIGSAAAVASVIPGGQLVGAALGLAATLTGLFTQIFSGCGQSCTLTSEAANKIEDLLRQNELAYLAIPANQRYKSVQAAYLANFDNTWAQLVSYCGQPSFGKAGVNCVDDRERGACKWKNGGQCWNWFIGYRDPIANDPNVVPDPAPATQSVSSLVSAITPGAGTVSIGGVDLSGFLLPAALIGGGLLLLAGGR